MDVVVDQANDEDEASREGMRMEHVPMRESNCRVHDAERVNERGKGARSVTHTGTE